MVKGKLLTALVIIGVLMIPFSIFAAASDATAVKTVRSCNGIDMSRLTEQQKADAAGYSEKIADLQKEFIDKMVQNGSMTKEDGAAAKLRIDDSLKAFREKGGIYGIMPGKGMGCKDGPDKSFADTSKLTDKQKADINATVKKINALHRDFTDTAVKDGLLTKLQGDAIKSRLDSIPDSGTKMYFGIMGRAGLPGMGFFGLLENDTSKLTAQQKKDLDDYSMKMTALRKELIGKYVSTGAITQEQGNKMLKRMEQKAGPGLNR